VKNQKGASRGRKYAQGGLPGDENKIKKADEWGLEAEEAPENAWNGELTQVGYDRVVRKRARSQRADNYALGETGSKKKRKEQGWRARLLKKVGQRRHREIEGPKEHEKEHTRGRLIISIFDKGPKK